MTELYMHAPKCAKRGLPMDRVFVVSSTVQGDKVAWRCQLGNDGLVHPAFKRPLKLNTADLKRGKLERGAKGIKPNAKFKPNSMYQRVTLAQLKERAEDAAPIVKYLTLRAIAKVPNSTWVVYHLPNNRHTDMAGLLLHNDFTTYVLDPYSGVSHVAYSVRRVIGPLDIPKL